ncbi:MAG: hypothetical protein KKF53_01980 [Nanoarchaeota archaeon]|nr:hypothetical protein [Nanoarchaeota archaeon]
MNIIAGTICNAALSTPAANQPGLNYQEIIIQGNDGQQYRGKIGFKKGTGYAKGMPVQVTADPNSDGTYYFKKYNPGYANQQQQSPPPIRPMPLYLADTI